MGFGNSIFFQRDVHLDKEEKKISSAVILEGLT